MNSSRMITLTISSENIFTRQDLKDIVDDLIVKHSELESRDRKFQSWLSIMHTAEFHFHRTCSVSHAVDDVGVPIVESVKAEDPEEKLETDLRESGKDSAEAVEQKQMQRSRSMGENLWKGRLRVKRDLSYPK